MLRYRGNGPYPAAAVRRIRAVAKVVEDAGRMMLVEAPEQSLRSALGSDKDWIVAPEVVYEHPDPRARIK